MLCKNIIYLCQTKTSLMFFFNKVSFRIQLKLMKLKTKHKQRVKIINLFNFVNSKHLQCKSLNSLRVKFFLNNLY